MSETETAEISQQIAMNLTVSIYNLSFQLNRLHQDVQEKTQRNHDLRHENNNVRRANSIFEQRIEQGQKTVFELCCQTEASRMRLSMQAHIIAAQRDYIASLQRDLDESPILASDTPATPNTHGQSEPLLSIDSDQL